LGFKPSNPEFDEVQVLFYVPSGDIDYTFD